jgi:hypothetical protein
MKPDHEIKLRKRNEELIKFWAEYLLLLMIALIGVYIIMPRANSINVGIAILSSLLATFLCFSWFMVYHKKTSDMMLEKHLKEQSKE